MNLAIATTAKVEICCKPDISATKPNNETFEVPDILFSLGTSIQPGTFNFLMILTKGQYDLSTFIQPLNHKEGIFVTPYNVRYLATYLHPNADIQGRVIHFGPGTTSQEKLLEIPLGEVDQSRLTIIITVGLGKSHPNTPGTDSDLDVGISDRTNQNLVRISDKDNYSSLPPCRPIDGTHDDFRVSMELQFPQL